MDEDEAYRLGWSDGWRDCMDFVELAIRDGYTVEALTRMIANMRLLPPSPPPFKQGHPDIAPVAFMFNPNSTL